MTLNIGSNILTFLSALTSNVLAFLPQIWPLLTLSVIVPLAFYIAGRMIGVFQGSPGGSLGNTPHRGGPPPSFDDPVVQEEDDEWDAPDFS